MSARHPQPLRPETFVPRWPAPSRVRSLCSTRRGGASAAPWDSLNLGDHVGDDPAAVAANRAAYAQALGGARPVFLRQVHGVDCVALDAATPDGTEADACVATGPGVACTIMVADCLPVLLCDDAGTRVAAAHAGWRGLAGGVLASALQGFDPARTLAWLGPCIGPTAFEVGDEVRAAFLAQAAGNRGEGNKGDDEARDAAGGVRACFRPAPSGLPGKWLADLAALARLRLQALGLPAGRIHGNDGSTAWCTVSDASRFFSHRRDRTSGRLAASIWLA